LKAEINPSSVSVQIVEAVQSRRAGGAVSPPPPICAACATVFMGDPFPASSAVASAHDEVSKSDARAVGVDSTGARDQGVIEKGVRPFTLCVKVSGEAKIAVLAAANPSMRHVEHLALLGSGHEVRIELGRAVSTA